MAYLKPQTPANAKAQAGSKFIHFFKSMKDSKTSGPGYPALQGDTEFTSSGNSSTETTKQGTITTPGQNEESYDYSQRLAVDDLAVELIKKARSSGEVLANWLVNTNEDAITPTTGSGVPSGEKGYKCPAYYAEVIVDDYKESYPGEGSVEISGTMKLQGERVEGFVILTDKDLDVIKKQYGFKDFDEVGS